MKKIPKATLLLIALLLFSLLFYPFSDWMVEFLPEVGRYQNIDRYILLVLGVGVLFLCVDMLLPLLRIHERFRNKVFLGVGLLLSMGLRLSLFPFQSDDYLGGGFADWYAFIGENGGFAALKANNFTPYNVLYLYFLAATTYLPIHSLYAIKLLSVIFDYFAGWVVFNIIALRYGYGYRAFLAAYVVLFSPTVLLNGSFWAQNDMLYTSLLLGCLYFMMKFVQHPNADQNSSWHAQPLLITGILLFSVAFMFKLQAIFFALPIAFLYAKGKIQLTHLLLIPITCFVLMLPAWLLGRNLLDILLIYPRQFMQDPLLTFNAPNIYYLFPGAAFEDLHLAGLLMAFSACCFFLFLFFQPYVPLSHEMLLRTTLVSLILLPYLLPKMHERYFFPADIFAIVLAFWEPRYWFVPIVMGLVSLISYVPFLFDQETFPFQALSIALGTLLVFILQDFARYIISQKGQSKYD